MFFTSSTRAPLIGRPSIWRIRSPGRTPASYAYPSSADSTRIEGLPFWAGPAPAPPPPPPPPPRALEPSSAPMVIPMPPYRPVVRVVRSSACAASSYVVYGSSDPSIALTPVSKSSSRSIACRSTYPSCTSPRIAPKSSARSSTSPRPPSVRKAPASRASSVVPPLTTTSAAAKPSAKTPPSKASAVRSARSRRASGAPSTACWMRPGASSTARLALAGASSAACRSWDGASFTASRRRVARASAVSCSSALVGSAGSEGSRRFFGGSLRGITMRKRGPERC
mmetsp:Transcript_973/g.2954  ORF Transcript_973/g.2954 Transcript_973/m.2954 type:complete len:282 (+) Transcript_973:2128-2973(+)